MLRVSICVLLLAAVVAAHDFKQCGTTDHLHISSVTLVPDLPLPGKNLQVLFSGKTDTPVTGGSAQLVVSVFNVPIAKISFDICTQMGLTCPVSGNFNASINYVIPGAAPAGVSASAKVEVHDSNGAPLDCISMAVKVGSKELMSAVDTVGFMYESWRQHFGVEMTPEEYVSRKAIFAANHMLIASHNAKGESWTMAHNEFSHMTWDEFRAAKVGGTRPEVTEERAIFDEESVNLPESVDWNAAGAVTPVKNQGQCGSCWAFSTTGSLEGAYFIKNKNLVSFSEQQLVDCDLSKDEACQGGLMDNAFAFIKQNGGLCTEADYPYVGRREICRRTCKIVNGSAVANFTDVAKTELALATAISRGPVSVAIEADQLGFQFYFGGVFTGNCGTNLDHGVLAVGYGVENNVEYWLVKNSWGPSWGLKGFIKIQKGKKQAGGQCGILLSASYPTL